MEGSFAYKSIFRLVILLLLPLIKWHFTSSKGTKWIEYIAKKHLNFWRQDDFDWHHGVDWHFSSQKQENIHYGCGYMVLFFEILAKQHSCLRRYWWRLQQNDILVVWGRNIFMPKEMKIFDTKTLRIQLQVRLQWYS